MKEILASIPPINMTQDAPTSFPPEFYHCTTRLIGPSGRQSHMQPQGWAAAGKSVDDRKHPGTQCFYLRPKCNSHTFHSWQIKCRNPGGKIREPGLCGDGILSYSGLRPKFAVWNVESQNKIETLQWHQSQLQLSLSLDLQARCPAVSG